MWVKARPRSPTMRHLHRKGRRRRLAEATALRPTLGIGVMCAVLGVEVDEEEREAVELAGLAIGFERKEQTDLGFERLARPDLATVDDPATHAVFGGSGDDAAVSVPASGSVTPKATCRSRRRRGRNVSLSVLVAEFHDRVQAEHREVQRSGTVHCRVRCGDPVEDERGLGDALSAPAVGLGDGDADPATGSPCRRRSPTGTHVVHRVGPSTCRRTSRTRRRRPRRSSAWSGLGEKSMSGMLGGHLVASRVRRDERSPTGRPRRLANRRQYLHRRGCLRMVSMEITVISLAFPEIPNQFSETSESALSWIFSAYNIGVASLLLIGGWLSSATAKRILPDRRIDLPARFPVCRRFRRVQRDADWRPHRPGGRRRIAAPAGLAWSSPPPRPLGTQMAIGIWGAAGRSAAAAGPTLSARCWSKGSGGGRCS